MGLITLHTPVHLNEDESTLDQPDTCGGCGGPVHAGDVFCGGCE